MSDFEAGGVRRTRRSVQQDKTMLIQCQHYFFRMNDISVRLTGLEEKNVPIGAFSRFGPVVTVVSEGQNVSRFDCASRLRKRNDSDQEKSLR